METKKYKLTNKTYFNHLNKWLYRIEAIIDFGNIKKGDLGGWIEREENLSQDGNCWVFNDAMVHGNAMVEDDAIISGNAMVEDDAIISGNAMVFGHAKVSCDAHVFDSADIHDNAMVFGHAKVSGNVVVGEDAMIHGDAEVRDNAWIHGHAEICDKAFIMEAAVITDHAIVRGDACIRGCSLVRGNAQVISKREVFTAGPFEFGEITCTPDIYRKLQISCGYKFIGGIEEFCQEMLKEGSDYALLLPLIQNKEKEWITLPLYLKEEDDD